MAEIYTATNPEQRIYVDGVSVKFRAGVADVPDELAEVLLQRDGFSTSPDGEPAPDETDVEAEVERRLAVEVERVTTEAKAEIEAEVERRVTEALAAADNQAPTEETPAKRGPGRPKKSDTAE